MKLEVKNLVFAPVGEKESFTIELFNEEVDEDNVAERIKGDLDLTKLNDEILARFKGSAKVKSYCDRCLAGFSFELPIKFTQEYLLDRSKAEDGNKLFITSHFEIEVTEPARQEILSSLPVKKLCKEDCAGICISCGKNLNVEKCKCKTR